MKNQNGLALFNAMKAEAKALGIDITGMKKDQIEAAIVAKQEEFLQNNPDQNENTESQNEEVVIQITNELREQGLLRRGRPAVEGSARQQRMKARAEKIAAGISIKPGRPKVEKTEAVPSVEVEKTETVAES